MYLIILGCSMEVSDHRYTKTAFGILTVCGWDSNLSHHLLSQFKFGVCNFDVVTSIFRLMCLPLYIFIKAKAGKYIVMPIKNIKINYNHNASVCELL